VFGLEIEKHFLDARQGAVHEASELLVGEE
jgi:hypothetical protein